MEWFYLICAGVLEVTWATTMKMSCGFSKLLPSILTAVGYIASAVFLSLALKKLPLNTTYAMWTGFGMIGTSILGWVLFQETLSPVQIFCIVMIGAGIVGLKLFA
ncbi:DMT family transporter [Catenisphaera adipataccumulans]|jgi:quaternary ammonium compound-resistance protein SugE|uniref:Quaternary ammonium compound-resistance protein SugE n=1 Tax=Catenisphaera adipataccumulans TaxID=700500 RepID=A0A7W8CXI9_9FIRM|nr:multidrug efflux SMR transporter [Catenisphaera adipataccumulans]MBB5182239.1 quaternary ammonium compound-resistance protein SugE [Catenisphaera adipataccumulans]